MEPLDLITARILCDIGHLRRVADAAEDVHTLNLVWSHCQDVTDAHTLLVEHVGAARLKASMLHYPYRVEVRP